MIYNPLKEINEKYDLKPSFQDHLQQMILKFKTIRKDYAKLTMEQ